MVKVPVFKLDGTQLDEIEVDPAVFGGKVLPKTMHQMVIGYGAHKRVGTHSAKSKGEIAGTSRKPYRQKGTGRARAGSRKSPLWRGGGIVFPPKPRDYDPTLPKKMRHAALNSALLSKFLDREVVVIDGLSVDAPKTKTIVELLKKIDVAGKSCLVGTAKHDENVYLSARNIARVNIAEIRNFNAYDVLRHARLVLSREAFNALVESRKQAASAKAN